MKIFVLLLLPLLFSGLVFGAIIGGKKHKAEPGNVPGLDYDNLTTSERVGEHFGNRNEWQTCKELYPKLAVGDLIELVGQNPVLKKFDFQHWALYTGLQNGTHYIVNYHLDPANLDFGTIMEEALNGEFDERRCRINNRQDWIDPPYLPWFAVYRARSMIGKRATYNLHDNNCEHLVRWSRNGVRKSLQIIKRGKGQKEKRDGKRAKRYPEPFETIYQDGKEKIEKGIEVVKETAGDAIESVKEIFGGAKEKIEEKWSAFLINATTIFADKWILNHYDADGCESLAVDIDKYRRLLEEDDVKPNSAPPDNEVHDREFRIETHFTDAYFCPGRDH